MALMVWLTLVTEEVVIEVVEDIVKVMIVSPLPHFQTITPLASFV